MDKDKLIEKLKYQLLRKLQYQLNSKDDVVYITKEEADLILTSLTAPVPDGKEEYEECAAKQNKIEELNNELEMTVDELINYYRDKWKECRSKLRDSHRY